jgi:hypothetical protein
MGEKTLALLGAGIVTDAYADVGALAREVGVALQTEVLEESAVAGVDPLPALAIRALHQAFAMAEAKGDERTGLIVVTQWGMINATVSYLESMLEAGGKYASPRHFTRSVYSAATSLVAIHFGIRGPCQSLAFALEEDAVTGALAPAWRMLASKRCERVAIVWGEQEHLLVGELVRRAARDLKRREYERFVEGVGFGAVGVIVGLRGGRRLELGRRNEFPVRGKPYPMDCAVNWLAGMLKGTHP